MWKEEDQKYTEHSKVDLYETVKPLLTAMYEEFKELSKKKPDSVLNQNKMKMVNRLLENCQKILNNEPTLQFLDLIDEDNIPQNSDVVLMLSQYVTAMDQFRSTYYGSDGLGRESHWFVF